jgi:hypothetical protein
MQEPNRDRYRQKLNRIEDAVRLKKPDRIPIILEFGYFVARYAGITYQELIYDPWSKAMSILWAPGVCGIGCIAISTCHAPNGIGNRLVSRGGNRAGCILQSLQLCLLPGTSFFPWSPSGFLLRHDSPMPGRMRAFRIRAFLADIHNCRSTNKRLR